MRCRIVKKMIITAGIVLTIAGCNTSIFGENVGAGGIGDPCEEKGQCHSGLCLLQEMYGESTGWKNGYCTDNCSETCSDDATCVQLLDGFRCLANCQVHEDCRDGYRCNQEVLACLPDCRQGWKCGDSIACSSEGVCSTVDGIQGNMIETGGPCTWNSECVSSYCIAQRETVNGLSWADGMCSNECGTCQAGFSCTALGDAAVCLPNCSTNTPCRNGYICNPTLKVCLPDCRLGFDCGISLTCNSEGVCSELKDTEINATNLGGDCTWNVECKSNYCIPETKTNTGLSWTDGMCSSECGTCQTGFTCTALGDASVCLPNCSPTVPCRNGYVCNPTLNVCLPDCRLGFECGDSLTCGQKGDCVSNVSI